RFPADPSLALQRSRSTAQLKEADAWKEDVQEMLDHLQDASSTRSYRDSLKDAQSKVLRSTSFRRRDLTSSTWGPAHVSSNPQPWSQDKKGPKTLPKPQGLFLPPQATASPHTPKERQEVSPGARGPSPPALPSIPPVGPPPRTRICGRRRLGVEQKKRSYSEPDKMNEIGVSDPETAALYRRGGGRTAPETSVADRRRMFELAASGAANGPLPSSRSRPDLRQAQHDALAEYVVRKKALKREEGSRGPGARPRSVYLPPEGSSHTTPSVVSVFCPPGLQDRAHPGPEAEPNRENGSSGGHPLQVQPRRAPAEPQQNPGVSKKLSSALQRAQSIRDSGKSASTEDLLERSEEGRAAPRHQRSRSSPAEGSLSQKAQSGTVTAFCLFQDLPPAAAATLGAFLPAAANRYGRTQGHAPSRPVLSECWDLGPKSCSSCWEFSSFLARIHFHNGPLAVTGGILPGSLGITPAGNRLADMLASGDQVSQNRLNTAQPERRLQDANLPVSSWQTLTLRSLAGSERGGAASGSGAALPPPWRPPSACSAPSPRRGSGAGPAVTGVERLSQVNLDAIVFPGVSDGGPSGPPEAEPQSLSVANGPDRSRTPPSPPTTQPEPRCLRISEPGLTGSGDQRLLDADVSQADSDEVFLHDLEDFPPPPPDVDPGAGSQTGGRSVCCRPLLQNPFAALFFLMQTFLLVSSSPPSSPPSSSPLHSPPGPGLPPDLERQPPGVASKAPPAPALEYQPLPRREKTYEDLRVEALAKQLVWRDSSLAPLLDMFGVKSTMELMEEVFTPNSRLGGKSPWQRRGSRYFFEDTSAFLMFMANRLLLSRVQDLCDPPEMDPDQTQDEDLNAKKVELCEALRHSVAALQQEREALREEQRHHRALGASIDSLVQERLKANERDKYSVFVGDLERIVNLLLSLCSRLMRIDRALLALERDPLLQEDAAEERDSLLHKRSLVLRQTDDAQELKENLERRQRVVHGILSGYLTPAQLRDYRGFVSAKPSLLIRQRHLDNLIRHREEHLSRLADSLPRELADGGLRGRPFSPPSPTPLPFPPITTPG
uniref:Shroom family member 3 n=1 Tax=Tetraodon nigroviridis TaxID=99883 RepID=H3CBT2_TETNG